MNKVISLINKLYGNQHRILNNVVNVMSANADVSKEELSIKTNGYHPVKAAEEDSHRFSYDNLGYPKDAVNNAEQDIQDIKHSKTARESPNFKAEISFDQQQIKDDKKVPADELVLISRLNSGKINRPAEPADIEMIYHNTHDSEHEIISRHPKLLAYTMQDARKDAKQDLN